jgi:cell division protein FtsQ
MRQVKALACFILKDQFYNAQIAQVDITPSRNFEMIPVIGNHIIEFGNGLNYKDKFRRLLVFYQQVVPKVGFDKYSKISVQFDKQVIGTHKGTLTKIDSLQAIKNIQKLIEDAKNVTNDSLFTSVDKNLMILKKAESTLSIKIETNTKESDSELNKLYNVPPSLYPMKKTGSLPNAVKKRAISATENKESKKPKAVMPRLNE